MANRRDGAGAVLPGELLAGRFRVECEIGTGGMADVYRARDMGTGIDVALKLLKPAFADQPQAIERLRREGEVLRALDHPAIVGLETFGRLDDGRIFIAMELLEGETLRERMKRDGRLEPEALLPIVTGICAGLSVAHAQGIVHRDLKPDNIFLVDDSAQGVKVLDFGISKVFGSQRITQTGEVLGTPRYMAPEQLSAEHDLDGRTDLYALGVILYEALAAVPPFLAPTPSDLIVAILHGKATPLRAARPDVSHTLAAVVERAMAKARDGRYRQADELCAAYRDAASSAARPDRKRVGVPTAALGTFESSPPVSATAPTQGMLRPGTFGGGTGSAAPAKQASPADPAPRVPTSCEAVSTSAESSPPAGSLPTLPERRTSTLWLVVAGMLAGALTAGAMVAWLVLRERSAEGQPAVERAPPPDVTRVLVDQVNVSGAVPGPRPEPEPATAPEMVPSDAGTPGEIERRASKRQRRKRSRNRRGTANRRNDVLYAARAALQRGDARACVALVDDALRLGPFLSALRLRGDCLLRAGDPDEALKSYERFCELATSASAIERMRPRVERLGGTCQ